jgi:hypothetical protein
MATVFISYKVEDRPLAARLCDQLKAAGHQIRLDTNVDLTGSSWRDDLMSALMESDAVVPVITPAALQSPFVIAEIGAARAFGRTDKKMALFPVLVGDLEIPRFIQDLFVYRLRDTNDDSVRVAGQDLNKALSQLERSRRTQARRTPRIFVSHRHKDEGIVRALVNVVQSAFEIEQADIRCTSVHPFRLPAGERTPDRLRSEIAHAEVVIGLITPDTGESSYVLFELGAAWSQGRRTFPLLARGATIAHIPAPIQDLHPLNLHEEADAYQLLDDLADAVALKRRDRVSGEVQEKIRALTEAIAAQK